MKPKKELLRVVKNNEGVIRVDLTGKMAGRGAYICKNPECYEKAVKGKKFEKTFESKIADEVYEALREELLNAK